MPWQDAAACRPPSLIPYSDEILQALVTSLYQIRIVGRFAFPHLQSCIDFRFECPLSLGIIGLNLINSDFIQWVALLRMPYPGSHSKLPFLLQVFTNDCRNLLVTSTNLTRSWLILNMSGWRRLLTAETYSTKWPKQCSLCTSISAQTRDRLEQFEENKSAHCLGHYWSIWAQGLSFATLSEQGFDPTSC